MSLTPRAARAAVLLTLLPAAVWSATTGGQAAEPLALACSADTPTVPLGGNVTLKAWARSSSGRALRYTWGATAGRIEGRGAEAHWTLAELRPGTFAATVTAGDGESTSSECLVRVTVRRDAGPRGLSRETGQSFLPPGQSEAAFMFFSWNPLLAWEVGGQAHTEGLVMVAMVGFVWAAMRGREWLAALALACAVYAKLVLLPLLCLYLCFVLRRRAARAIAIAAVVAALGVVLMLPFWQGAATVRRPMGTLVADSTLTARSLTDFVVWLVRPLGEQVGRNVYWVALALGTVLLGWFGLRAALRARSLQQVLRDGLVFFLLYDLIAAPWFQSWYMLWLLPLALAEEDERWRTLVAVYSVLALVQYGLPLDPVTYLVINIVVLRMLYPLLRSSPAAEALEATPVATA